MQLLATTPPPEWKAIVRAYAQARRVSSANGQKLKVGLVWGEKLAALAALASYKQAACLAEYMKEFGWQERLLGDSQEMHGCDVVFTSDAAAREDDPSFIRRPAMELWA